MTKLITILRNRFPTRGDLFSALAFTSFLVYGRMLFVFVWKVPSWLMFLTMDKILSILCYGLVVAFLESVGYVLFLALVCSVLPPRWFRQDFVLRSVWMITIWLVSWNLFFIRMFSLGLDGGLQVLAYIYPWLIATLMLVVLFYFLSIRIRALKSTALWLADRTLIYLFLLLPASLLGLLVVLVRNIS